MQQAQFFKVAGLVQAFRQQQGCFRCIQGQPGDSFTVAGTHGMEVILLNLIQLLVQGVQQVKPCAG